MKVETGLYLGVVRHTRVKPRSLSLRHRCFWLALDIDSIKTTTSGLRLLSHNRANILSFFDRDFGDGSERSLRQHVEHLLSEAGITETPANIVLFCMPRVLGYGFNPISLYLCSDKNNVLKAVVYEVHNTFGERHSYVSSVQTLNDRVIQSADKQFYVSPFMDMDLSYTFKLELRDQKLLLAISAKDAEGPLIFTSLSANRRQLTNRSLLMAWMAHPLLSLKVISAIHFHAARIWLKGVKLRLRPPPPQQSATVIQSGKTVQ